MLFKELREWVVKVFSAIVSMESLNCCIKLGTDHVVEINEGLVYLGFIFQEENPSNSGMVINEGHKPLKLGTVGNMRWSP